MEKQNRKNQIGSGYWLGLGPSVGGEILSDLRPLALLVKGRM